MLGPGNIEVMWRESIPNILWGKGMNGVSQHPTVHTARTSTSLNKQMSPQKAHRKQIKDDIVSVIQRRVMYFQELLQGKQGLEWVQDRF